MDHAALGLVQVVRKVAQLAEQAQIVYARSGRVSERIVTQDWTVMEEL